MSTLHSLQCTQNRVEFVFSKYWIKATHETHSIEDEKF